MSEGRAPQPRAGAGDGVRLWLPFVPALQTSASSSTTELIYRLMTTVFLRSAESGELPSRHSDERVNAITHSRQAVSVSYSITRDKFGFEGHPIR